MSIPDGVRTVVEAGRLGHLVTLNRDGSPHVTCIWVGVDGDKIVISTREASLKAKNLARESRVAISIETDRLNERGLTEYLVIHGRAEVALGDGGVTLNGLAQRYIGPGSTFGLGGHPDGVLLRIAPERFGGVGPWVE
ncbi:MAG: PPOX class F420-dependent oxidoreductase [Dehalococcoidia bacterium]|nr:PPOX class F420-dependent oxidoreductase [Dehalococcoidia bacterium]